MNMLIHEHHQIHKMEQKEKEKKYCEIIYHAGIHSIHAEKILTSKLKTTQSFKCGYWPVQLAK